MKRGRLRVQKYSAADEGLPPPSPPLDVMEHSRGRSIGDSSAHGEHAGGQVGVFEVHEVGLVKEADCLERRGAHEEATGVGEIDQLGAIVLTAVNLIETSVQREPAPPIETSTRGPNDVWSRAVVNFGRGRPGSRARFSETHRELGERARQQLRVIVEEQQELSPARQRVANTEIVAAGKAQVDACVDRSNTGPIR